MSLSRVHLDVSLLTGQLAPQSLAGYQQDLTAYLQFCGDPGTALDATSLVRWRLHLAQDTRLSPSTINRRLAAVKRVVKETAVHGYVDPATAEAFRQVQGVSTKALKDRLPGISRAQRWCRHPARGNGLPGLAILADLDGRSHAQGRWSGLQEVRGLHPRLPQS